MKALSELLARMARELAASTLESLAALLEAEAGDAHIERSLNSARAREFWAQLRPFTSGADAVSKSALSLGLRVGLGARSWNETQGVELVWTGPGGDRGAWRRTEQALLDVVTGARETLWLVTYALYPVPSLSSELEAATARGVELRVVAESPASDKIRHSGVLYWQKFLPPQTRLYEWPVAKRGCNDAGDYGTLHAKVALADRDLALVSSANLTDCALNYNLETGVLLRGAGAEKLARQFDDLVKEGIWVAVN